MQHAEILARRAEGWVWLDERVPVEEAYDEVGEAVEAGLSAIEAEIEAGRLGRAAAAELAADARFELGANEHHLGGQDSEAIEALASFENRIRERA